MAISQHCFDYNFWDHTNWLGRWNGGYDLYEKKRKCTIVTVIKNKQPNWIFENPDQKIQKISNCTVHHKITKKFFYNVCPSIQQLLLLPTLHVGSNLLPM